MSTYVIADIGACHDGDIAKMLFAVDAARLCGVNALKFQWTSDPVRMAERRGRAAEDGYAKVYDRFLAWPRAWHQGLAQRCADAGLDYMCTAFLPEDVDVVAPHVARFKVASFEAEDIELLAAHRPYASQQVIVSCGMLDFDSMEDYAQYAHGIELAIGAGRPVDLVLLQCTSSYPAPHEALGLTAIRGGLFHGFSDHSHPADVWTGALAVVAGAEIVEAHLRLVSTAPSNPDYPHAMTPGQFCEYVRNIRFAERCLGGGEKRRHACETAMAQYRVTPISRLAAREA